MASDSRPKVGKPNPRLERRPGAYSGEAERDLVDVGSTSDPLVFISHRHDDRDIALVLGQFFKDRCAGKVRVHLSSNPEFEGPRVGKNVNDALKRALAGCDVVVLVFTTETDDWSYCMWECGVATDPSDQKSTEVIVLQCGGTAPKPYADQLRVDARDVGLVTAFVKTMLADPDLFHGRGALTGFHPEANELKSFAVELHTKLATVLPPLEPPKLEERVASSQVRIDLDGAALEALRAAYEKGDQSAVAEVIADQGKVKDLHLASALFGFHVGEATTVGTVLEEWSKQHAGPARWFDSLAEQIATLVCGKYPVVKWAPYRTEPGRATIPYLAGCRIESASGVVQLDTYFVPMSPRPVPVVERMIRLEEMFHKNLADTPGDTIKLSALVNEMSADNRSRVPMLGEGGRPRFMVHKSMIDEYVSRRALAGNDVTDLTVHDLLIESDMAEVFTQSCAVVDEAATMEEALAAMNENPGCQDVFVTADGSREGAVVGWLTDKMFIEPA
jgi:hypothetical protein